MSETTSFDDRLVRYEEIHAIKQDDFRDFVNAAQVRGRCRLLDCGCGYGAVTREILAATDPKRLNGEIEVEIDLIDESSVQLERAKQELHKWLNVAGADLTFISGSFPEALGEYWERYDVVACKMVLHEVSKEQQLPFLEHAHHCLKPGGRLVLWDVCLSGEIVDFYRPVVRAKDELAGYSTMVARRNFLTEEELMFLFQSSSFRSLSMVKNILYRFETKKRLGPEFCGDIDLFCRWQEFIRQAASVLSPSALAGLRYSDDGDNISFDVRKVIVLGSRSSANS